MDAETNALYHWYTTKIGTSLEISEYMVFINPKFSWSFLPDEEANNRLKIYLKLIKKVLDGESE